MGATGPSRPSSLDPPPQRACAGSPLSGEARPARAYLPPGVPMSLVLAAPRPAVDAPARVEKHVPAESPPADSLPGELARQLEGWRTRLERETEMWVREMSLAGPLLPLTIRAFNRSAARLRLELAASLGVELARRVAERFPLWQADPRDGSLHRVALDGSAYGSLAPA